MTSLKISSAHVFSFENLTDYFLGNIDDLKSILEYRKTEKEKANTTLVQPRIKHFTFLPENLTTTKPSTRYNQIIYSILSLISPTFTLMKPELQKGFLSEFLKYLAVEMTSIKSHHKSLLTKYHLRSKKIDELLLCGRNMDSDDDFQKVYDYIAIRFGFNYAIIYSNQSYHRFVEFPNRPYLIIAQKDEKYYYVCEDLKSDQFMSVLKSISPELKSFDKYKVAELKELAKKYGISASGKKEDIYNTIVRYFNSTL